MEFARESLCNKDKRSFFLYPLLKLPSFIKSYYPDPLSQHRNVSFSVLEGGVRSRIQGTYLLLVVKDRGIMGNGKSIRENNLS